MERHRANPMAKAAEDLVTHNSPPGLQVVVGPTMAHHHSTSQRIAINGASVNNMEPLELALKPARGRRAPIEHHHQQQHPHRITSTQHPASSGQVHGQVKGVHPLDSSEQNTGTVRRRQSMAHLQTQQASGGPPSRESMASQATTNGVTQNNSTNNNNNNNSHNHQQSENNSMKCFKRPYTTEQMSYKQELVKRYCSQISQNHNQPQQQQPTSSSLTSNISSQLQANTFEAHTQYQQTPPDRTCTSPIFPLTSSASLPVPHPIYRHNSKTPIRHQPTQLQYVTLEDFRCPCFMIAGEPYLSMPSLLKFLHKRFSLLRIVKTIEDFNVNFWLATDEQMDTLKIFVLAPSSKCCPLIRHSDADRITLDLHEQCYKRKAPRDPEIYRKQKDLSRLKEQQQQNQLMIYSTNSYSTMCNTTLDQSIGYGFSSSTILHNMSPIVHETANFRSQHANLLENLTIYNNPTNLMMKQNVPNQVFHTNQAQNLYQEETAISLKNVTIRVYHKCFGKCTGLYYPELLHKRQYKCIECAACGRMFVPKRFIGHVHCPKEKNVANWGFNSYNWRQYIRLCKKQAHNNLPDKRLVEQFKLLQRLKDAEQNQSDDLTEYNFDKLNYAEQLRQLTERQQDENYEPKPNSSSDQQSDSDKKNEELANYRPPRALAAVVISAYTCRLIDNYSATTTNTYYTSYTSSSQPTPETSNCDDPKLAGQPSSFATTSSSTSNSSSSSNTNNNNNNIGGGCGGSNTNSSSSSSSSSSSTTMTTSYKFDDTSAMNILPVSSSIDNYRTSTGTIGELNLDTASATIYNHSPLSLLNTLHADYNHLYGSPYSTSLPPTVPHHELGDLERILQSHYQQHQQISLANHQQSISEQHTELKRENYISSCMNTYFKVTGIYPTLANNILEHILDVVRKSKFIT